MARTEARIIDSFYDTGRQDAGNVSSGPDSLRDFFRDDPAQVTGKTRAEVEAHIANKLVRNTEGEDWDREMSESLDPDERFTPALARKALRAWAEGWASVAAPDVMRCAARGDDDPRENPTRRRQGVPRRKAPGTTRYTLRMSKVRDQRDIPVTVTLERKRGGRWTRVESYALRYDAARDMLSTGDHKTRFPIPGQDGIDAAHAARKAYRELYPDGHPNAQR